MRTTNQLRNRQLRRRWAALRNTALVAGCIVGAPYAYNFLYNFIRSDPFVGLFKHTPHDLADTVGIEMDRVDLRDYNGAKLVSSAYADRVDVLKDRSSATLYGVRNGQYNGSKGSFGYSATNAVWNFQTKQVTVSKSVEVQNKDLALKAEGLVFDDRTNLLRIQGDVHGMLYKGNVVASTVMYNMKTGGAETGPFEWTGKVAIGIQDEDKAVPKKWTISGSHWKSDPKDSNIIDYTNATASDEDLIIVAPSVEQNRKTDVLTATGGIHYYSGKADITADKCVVYRKEKRAVLTGHVFMYVKPKAHEDDPPKVEPLPDFKPVSPAQVVVNHDDTPLNKEEQQTKEDELRSSKNLRDFPMVIVSQQTEYWYAKGTRHAVITGEPQGRQKVKEDEWRHVWSHTAYYDGEKETLKLVSSEGKKDALMKNSLGDNMKATDILVSTKEGDDSVEGNNLEGDMYTANDEVGKDDKKQGAAPPTTTKKVGGG